MNKDDKDKGVNLEPNSNVPQGARAEHTNDEGHTKMTGPSVLIPPPESEATVSVPKDFFLAKLFTEMMAITKEEMSDQGSGYPEPNQSTEKILGVAPEEARRLITLAQIKYLDSSEDNVRSQRPGLHEREKRSYRKKAAEAQSYVEPLTHLATLIMRSSPSLLENKESGPLLVRKGWNICISDLANDSFTPGTHLGFPFGDMFRGKMSEDWLESVLREHHARTSADRASGT